MGFPAQNYQTFSVQNTLGTGDASKMLLDVGPGVTIVVMNMSLIGLTPAAQALYVGDTSGNVRALNVAASFPAHGQLGLQLIKGLPLTEGEDLIIKPAAAGPSVHVVAEGYLLKSNVNLGA